MMIYRVVLFLVIFGAVTSCMDAIGITPVILPSSQVGINEGQVRELNQLNDQIGALSWFTIPFMLLKVLFGAFLAVITILPLMFSYGIPLSWGLMIQTPIWLVEAYGLYQMVSGHGGKAAE